MTSTERPSLTIEHELPGRLRVRLSHGLRHQDRLRRMIAEHTGIRRVEYTPLTRSVLTRYDPERVSAEEIVIRIAFGLSLEHDQAAVTILTRPPLREWTDTSFYAGVALLAALGFRVLGKRAQGSAWMDWIAGFTTAGAVLEHGWQEYRRRGNFDPEVLTVTYLLTALLRGNALPAAIVTWMTSFGRHLVKMPSPGVEVLPAEMGRERGSPRFEMVVAPDRTVPDKMTFFGFIPMMLFNALTGTRPGQHASLIGDIRRVAKMHDDVLEGVSDFRKGIPLRVRDWSTDRRAVYRGED